mmetsp:Transcript_11772/g.17607  ORF Transcript_11772/g.17607 Transcript_11772/m.17607 type:complete len:220 (-) Transcript_11772:141-800(-)
MLLIMIRAVFLNLYHASSVDNLFLEKIWIHFISLVSVQKESFIVVLGVPFRLPPMNLVIIMLIAYLVMHLFFLVVLSLPKNVLNSTKIELLISKLVLQVLLILPSRLILLFRKRYFPYEMLSKLFSKYIRNHPMRLTPNSTWLNTILILILFLTHFSVCKARSTLFTATKSLLIQVLNSMLRQLLLLLIQRLIKLLLLPPEIEDDTTFLYHTITITYYY